VRVRTVLAQAAEVALIVVATGALGLWCSVPSTAALARENPASTAFIDLRRAEAAAAGKPFELRWQWRPIGAISRYLRAAVVYAEDYNFYRHDGVDWDAIEHAVAADWNHGAMAVGGSTITQQLAKNLYLSPRRSVIRKLREALIAFSLEDDLPKQRILELYLNVVEWGDGVFGAEAAARYWYHRSAQQLTPAEAVRLACALPNPITRAPTVRDADLTRKAVRLTRFLRLQGLIDARQERATLDELGAGSERVLGDRPAEPARPDSSPAAPDPRGASSTAPDPRAASPDPRGASSTAPDPRAAAPDPRGASSTAPDRASGPPAPTESDPPAPTGSDPPDRPAPRSPSTPSASPAPPADPPRPPG
jgi:monofunctional biosynthetic peptidoglycan transglycosylase